MNSLRVGILFLLLYAAAILSAQLTPHRYFCWAPFADQVSNQGVAHQISTKKMPRRSRPLTDNKERQAQGQIKHCLIELNRMTRHSEHSYTNACKRTEGSEAYLD
jgi:Ca2+/H+ antiporter